MMGAAIFLTTLISGLILLYVWYTEPRRLLLGAVFIIFILCMGVGLFSFLVANNQVTILVIIAILVVIATLSGPFLLIGNFLYNGYILIKREGFNFNNLLSVLFGIAIILYLTVWPIISDMTEQTIFNTIYVYFTFLIFYFVLVLNLYTVSMILNLIHFTSPELDYLIVLGAGLDGERVTPLLASRIDKAIAIYKKNPNIKLIMTGGQGEDEVVAEGKAMANYAIEQGIPKDSIIVEDRAVNTEENLLFSHALMD